MELTYNNKEKKLKKICKAIKELFEENQIIVIALDSSNISKWKTCVIFNCSL